MDGEGRWARREFLRRSAAAAALVIGGGPILAACSKSSTAGNKTTSTLDRLRAAGSVTVGYDSDPPWSFTTSSGALTGIAAEVATATFKEMGIPKVKGALVGFGDLIPGLIASRFDSIGDALFITPDRCQQVLFSNPFVVDGEAFAVAKGNPFHLTNFESIGKNPHVRLGLIGGSAESQFAKAAGVNSSQISTFNDLTTAIEGIGAHRVDAVAFDVVAIAYSVRTTHADVDVTPAFTEILKGKPQYGASAFIFRKSDTSLLNAFNEAQQKLLTSGKVGEICQSFVGSLQSGITQAERLSVAQLCAS
jgi:polar amino acid transport system substrate-binding protein